MYIGLSPLSLSLSLSVSVSFCLATSFSLYMSYCLSLSPFTLFFFSLSLSIYLSLALSTSLNLHPSLLSLSLSLSLALSLPLHLSLHLLRLLVSSQHWFILTLFCSSSLLSFPHLCSTCQVGSSSSFDCLLYSTPGSPLFHKAADISSDFAQVNATTSHLPTSEYRIEAATLARVSVDVKFGRRPRRVVHLREETWLVLFTGTDNNTELSWSYLLFQETVYNGIKLKLFSISRNCQQWD